MLVLSLVAHVFGYVQLASRGGALVATGNHSYAWSAAAGKAVPFRVKGIVWSGAERAGSLPFGLDAFAVDEYMALLERHAFNMIRLTFSHALVLKNCVVEASARRHVRAHAFYKKCVVEAPARTHS